MRGMGISVVVCTYNGVDRLGKTLDCILWQDADNFPWELIVVDNNSADDSGAFCKQYLQATNTSIEWSVVMEKQPGLNHARMRGLNTARYEVVLFCDDDNYLDPHYIRIGQQLMSQHSQMGALGGNGIPLFESEKPAWFDQYAYSFAVGPQAEQSGRIQEEQAEVYGAGCFFRKAPLVALFSRGFKTIMTDRLGKTLASGGDVEWCYLMQLCGYEIWYDERLTFYHLMPATRMSWEYYLQLKAGISMGAGRLIPYQVWLSESDKSKQAFVRSWYKRYVQFNFILIRLTFKKWLTSSKENKPLSLALAKAAARVKSMQSSKTVAWQHFRQLNSFFGGLRGNH